MRKKNVVFCLYMLTLLANVSIEANSVDPDQASHIGAYTVC